MYSLFLTACSTGKQAAKEPLGANAQQATREQGLNQMADPNMPATIVPSQTLPPQAQP